MNSSGPNDPARFAEARTGGQPAQFHQEPGDGLAGKSFVMATGQVWDAGVLHHFNTQRHFLSWARQHNSRMHRLA